MRGGFLHNRILVERLARAFRSTGATVSKEVYIQREKMSGYADLLATYPSGTILVEVELSTRRLTKDLWKRSALGADELWIVVPTHYLVSKMDAALARQDARQAEVFVLTLGQALQRVSQCFPMISPSNDRGKQKRNESSSAIKGPERWR